MTSRSALSLIEIAVAALIIGVSGVAIMELLRSTTWTFEVTEVEVLARGLASDVLERFSGTTFGDTPEIPPELLGTEVAVDKLLTADPTLSRGYPLPAVEPTLARHRATVLLQRDVDIENAPWAKAPGLDRYRVTVRWQAAEGRSREVTLVRLHARR